MYKASLRFLVVLLLLLLSLQLVESFSTTPSWLSSSLQPTWKHRPSREISNRLWFENSQGGSSSSTTSSSSVPSPDPAILLSAQSDENQRLGVIAIGVGILVPALAVSNFWSGLENLTGGLLATKFSALPLGLVFFLVGGTHFVYQKEYSAIVPPKGTWGGLWNVPAPGAKQLGVSEEIFHVLWTGAAEMICGALLVMGGLGSFPVQTPATLLFLLVLGVTPANIYMFSHNVPLAMAPPLQYPRDHIIRGIMQIVLLSIFFNMATTV